MTPIERDKRHIDLLTNVVAVAIGLLFGATIGAYLPLTANNVVAGANGGLAPWCYVRDIDAAPAP